MIQLHTISVLCRAAALELSHDTPYHAPAPFTVLVNGEARGTYDTNVFTLFDLTPDMHYTVRTEAASGESAECVFVTPKEAICLDVTAFGAVGDGKTDCTAALQAALCACPAGGTVYVPEGVYLSYPLFLRSDILLYLARGAVLLGGTQRARYPVMPGMVQHTDGETSFGTWEGNPLDCYAALLTGLNAANFSVAGQGIVDGNAAAADWWLAPKKKNGAWRPRTMFFNRCEHVTLLGVTLRNSPSWTLHPYYCSYVDVLGLTIQNPPNSPNTDGCDPECCTHVRILGTRISVGDDCISVKSGKYYMGLKHPRAGSDVLVRNCLLERGHGAVVVGSEISAGVHDLRVECCVMRDTDRGLRVKTRRGRGASSVVTGIVFSDILMERVKTPFVINMFYCCDPDGHCLLVRSRNPMPLDELTPAVGSLYCRNIVCTDSEYAGCFFCGLPESPIDSVTLERVRIDFAQNAGAGTPAMMADAQPVSRLALCAENVRALTLRDVTFTDYEGEMLQTANVAQLTQE